MGQQANLQDQVTSRGEMPLRLPNLIHKQTLIISFCAILCGSVQNVKLAPLNVCRYRRDERVKVTNGRCSRCRPLPPSFFCHYFFPPAKLLKFSPSFAPSAPAVHHHRQSRSLPFLGCRLFFLESLLSFPSRRVLDCLSLFTSVYPHSHSRSLVFLESFLLSRP